MQYAPLTGLVKNISMPYFFLSPNGTSDGDLTNMYPARHPLPRLALSTV